MKNTLTKLAAAGVLTLSATAAAMAGSVTQPGESAGLAAGAPLPPGFYFVETTDWGSQDTAIGKTNVGVTIPVLAWSTPWKILNARVAFFAAAPAVEAGTTVNSLVNSNGLNGTYVTGMYNPFFGGQLAWDLGGGFGFSYMLGAYLGVTSPVADPTSSLNQRFGFSYTGGGWNLTANVIYGTQVEKTDGHPDYLNVDLTATKAIGKWELGAVGYYATDLGITAPTSKFAAGALVGYDWGAMKTQMYVTRDVAHANMDGSGYDTRVWGRIILPLGDPFASSSPSSMMYHK